MKHRLNRPMLLSVAGAIALMAVLAILAPGAIRVAFSLVLVLFLPGFALTIILFDRARLGVPERLLLSLGVSVAITALIGLILNWTAPGLRATTLGIALVLVVAVECIVIAFAGRLQWTNGIHLPVALNFSTRQWVLMGLAALVTMMAVQVARSPAPQQGLDGYTMLWVQPAAVPDTIRLGVNSEEFETTKYQLKFEINGTLRDGETLELNPGEKWEGVFRLPTDYMAGNPLTVFLYRLDDPNEAYRHVIWWPEPE